MIVVSNSSPLIAFARIGRLNLLVSVYKKILIPVELHNEVVTVGRGLPGAEEIGRAAWIQVVPRKLPEHAAVAQACQHLGAGERGAILLAKSLPADLVLLDESKARRVALDAGLSIMGCLGALETAAQTGLVSDLRQVYIDLLRHGIRFEIKLLQDSLARFGLPKL